MKQMKGILRWPIALIIIGMSLIQACSIIEDSDIQSQEELKSRLKLSTIELRETNNNGIQDAFIGAGVATYNDDKLSKIQWSNVSVHSNTEVFNRLEEKLRFNYFFDKDDIEAPEFNNANITMNISYNSSNQPDRITHVDDRNGFVFESFDFTYDGSGRVISVITNRSNLSETTVWEITDEISYSDISLVESMSRIRKNVNSGSTTSLQYSLTRSDNIIQISRQPNFETFLYKQFCPNEACFIYGPDDDFGSSARGNPQALFNISNNVVSAIELVDSRTGADESGNPLTFEQTRNPDTFFFHPILMFPDLFPDGVELSQLYLDDWWDVTNLDQMTGMTDEKVSINYNYTVD